MQELVRVVPGRHGRGQRATGDGEGRCRGGEHQKDNKVILWDVRSRRGGAF